MKILALMNSPSGVEFHRIIKPLTRLHIDEGIDVYKAQNIQERGVPELKEFDLVVFNRYLYKHHYNILEYMAKHNIPYVVDIDDYWRPVHHHPAHKFYGVNKITKAIEDAIRYASGVTVSTEEIAALVRKINPRVSILYNALDTTDEQWNWPKEQSDRIRIGWLAGITHHNDAAIIGPAITMAMRELEDVGFDFVYCGYAKTPANDSMLYRINDGNKTMKIKCMNGMNPDHYGKMLSKLDILVAPLEDIKYNHCKSDIKIQEAAAYGLPIICSNVMPYSDHRINSGVMLVENTTAAWTDALVRMVSLTKEQRMASGEENRMFCSELYDIEAINQKRLAFYKSCMNSSTHVRG